MTNTSSQIIPSAMSGERSRNFQKSLGHALGKPRPWCRTQSITSQQGPRSSGCTRKHSALCAPPITPAFSATKSIFRRIDTSGLETSPTFLRSRGLVPTTTPTCTCCLEATSSRQGRSRHSRRRLQGGCKTTFSTSSQIRVHCQGKGGQPTLLLRIVVDSSHASELMEKCCNSSVVLPSKALAGIPASCMIPRHRKRCHQPQCGRNCIPFHSINLSVAFLGTVHGPAPNEVSAMRVLCNKLKGM